MFLVNKLPGLINITLTSHGIISTLSVFEKPSTPCLEAQYTDNPGRHQLPLALVILMILPSEHNHKSGCISLQDQCGFGLVKSKNWVFGNSL